MSILTSWAPYFDSRVRMRGRTYHNEGRVEPAPPQRRELFRAVVQGQEDYVVVFKDDGSPQSVMCTCPHFSEGHYCKHIWASLLYLEASAGSDAAEQDDAFTDAAAPTTPKARKRSQSPRTAKSTDPAWLMRLSLLRSPMQSDSTPNESPAGDLKQVCYVIDPKWCRELNDLIVTLYCRQPRHGGWSKLKRLKLNPTAAVQLHEPQDREIGALLFGCEDPDDRSDFLLGEEYGPRRHRFRLSPGVRRTMLERMIASGRCFVRSGPEEDRPLLWDDDPTLGPWTVWLMGEKHDDDGESDDWSLQVGVELRRGRDETLQRMAIDEPTLLLGGVNGLVFYENKLAALDDGDALRWATHFRDEMLQHGQAGSLTVPQTDLPRFFDRLYRHPDLPPMDWPSDIVQPLRQVAPTPNMELTSPKGAVKRHVTARVWFTYDGLEAPADQPGRYLVAPPAEDQDEPPQLIQRDLEREREHQFELLRNGFRYGGSEPNQLTLPTPQTLPTISRLIEQGWRIIADQRAVRPSNNPVVSVASGLDWFELRGSVTYQTETGEQIVDLPAILKAAHEGRAVIELDDGSEGLLPQQWLEQHGLLTAIGKLRGDHVHFKSSQAALIDALLTDQPGVTVDETFAEARKKLHEFDGVQLFPPGEDFIGELRSYQQEGLGWMRFLDWFGVGGVLADDMGLGKTIQVLAMLDRFYNGADEPTNARSKQANAVKRPTLIIVPRSVVFNWIDEAERFTPKLRLAAYTGVERHALRNQFDEHHVIITSYGLMRRDIEALSGHEFHYIVLDEAQAIKNPNSQSARSARILRANHRLALTGTPVENHIGDLWSIFEFLNPGMLGANTRFAQLLRRGGGGGDRANGKAQSETVGQIARALRPFILRRTKSQVLDDLPPKTEQTIHCEMESAQRETYDELRRYYRNLLLKKTDANGDAHNELVLRAGASPANAANPMMVLEALLRLRQAACHPGLIDPKRVDEPSAKLQVLLDRLSDLIEEGHKALVFSQFTSMLAIVRKHLDQRRVRYGYLDGQTRHRKRVVDQFQNDPDCRVFLISLKAGGVGLNLTAAGYVFLLDPWWNPAVEAQAIDRTHRIGQTQHVFAYKLICEDTVEQRILELQQRKRELADAVIGGHDNLLRSLTRDDLEHLLR